MRIATGTGHGRTAGRRVVEKGLGVIALATLQVLGMRQALERRCDISGFKLNIRQRNVDRGLAILEIEFQREAVIIAQRLAVEARDRNCDGMA